MITSTQNVQVKKWRKLQTKKERVKSSAFLVEGYHLIEEAWQSNWDIKELIVQQGSDIPTQYENLPRVMVSNAVFKQVAQTNTPQGIIAVIKMNPNVGLSFTDGPVLLIDRIQDPGNLGTIIRTADAAGFSGVIVGEGTVDMYNDKVVRATQGSLFHIPIIEANLLDKITELKKVGFTIWASALKNARKFKDLEIRDQIGLIVGNEGAGINEDILHLADEIVTIPIYGKAESLNVSVAAGILMYYLRG